MYIFIVCYQLQRVTLPFLCCVEAEHFNVFFLFHHRLNIHVQSYLFNTYSLVGGRVAKEPRDTAKLIRVCNGAPYYNLTDTFKE